MKRFSSKHTTPVVDVDALTTVWPKDALEDIDDDAFARAIAAGREAEHRELVNA